MNTAINTATSSVNPAIIIQKLRDYGCAFLPGFLSKLDCNQLIDCFKNEIKYNNTPFLRMKSTGYDCHKYSKHGHITNPMLNLHLSPSANTYTNLLFSILNKSSLLSLLENYFKANPVLVQTMYFESAKGTETHFDSELIDSTDIGNMIGCWFALQNIDEEAGSFYYYPKSHLLDNQNYFDTKITQKYKEYIKVSNEKVSNYTSNNPRNLLKIAKERTRLLNELVEISNLQKVDHQYQTGDLILFTSKTLHGSHRPSFNGTSRNSFSAHFISNNHKMILRNSDTPNMQIAQKEDIQYNETDIWN